MRDLRHVIALALCAASAACGPDDASRAARDESAPAPPLHADSEGDVVVAEVRGQPVYGSCVRAQARARGASRREALKSCVAFELLAAEASDRGYASDPEVLATHRREAARAFMEEGFAADMAEPADIPRSYLETIWPRVEYRFDHPERRFTTYVRAPVPDDAEPGSDAETSARTLAEDIHEELGGYTNLDEDRFVALAAEIAGERELKRGEPLDFFRDSGAEEAFADAAFAIPEVGAISEPVRTKGGWDVILLTRLEPETRKSFEEAVPELREGMFESYRRRAFREWADEFRAELEIEVYSDNVDELAEGAEAPGPPR